MVEISPSLFRAFHGIYLEALGLFIGYSTFFWPPKSVFGRGTELAPQARKEGFKRKRVYLDRSMRPMLETCATIEVYHFLAFLFSE